MKKIFFLTFVILSTLRISYAQYTENYAASFNGFNSYISVPSTSGLSPNTAVTLEAWVYPDQLLPTTMAVIGKNYQSSYFLGIQSSGRIVFYPKGSSPFRSRVTGVVPINQWTHIAGTYDGVNTRIYINGLLDTSSTGYTGLIGTNSDSLFIGADRVGAVTSLFFRGRIDNVRIWAIGRTASQISANRFSPVEILSPTGDYANLRGSFQLDNSALNYGGNELNIGYGRNVSYIDYRNKGVNHFDYNNNLVLNGTTDYFSSVYSSHFNITTATTIEAWIRRDTVGSQPPALNIVNKSGGATRYNYALYLSSSGQLVFDISSGSYSVLSGPVITSSQWTHVAATYNSADGYAILYINGVYQTSTIFAGHPQIPNDPDNLFIGGIGASAYAANKFKGQIDAVRIWKTVRTPDQITASMHKRVTDVNLANFEFDENANSFRLGNTIVLSGGSFGGSAHISSSQFNVNTKLTSPVLLNDNLGFYSSNYYNSYKGFYVPDGNVSGITDSVLVPAGGSILNLNAYVLMSHTFASDMLLTLISPQGTQRILFNRSGGSGNDIMTIFSDDADSVASLGTLLNGPGINPPFSPSVKPNQTLSTFNGQNQQGWWKLKCQDLAGADRGYVNRWGLRILSGPLNYTLKLTALIQGFYDNVSDKMIRDTVRVFLKDANPPYNNIDSSKSVLDSSGKGNFTFLNVSPGDVFFIAVKHRNSIETWSSAGYNFTSDTLQYNFTLANSQAYGSNQIIVDTSPNKSAIYSGDVNQQGSIDLADVILINNAAGAFSSGYLSTDVNGNNQTDLADALLAYNNALQFIVKVTP